MPKILKMSPVAMIPHKNCDFRIILDLSFHLKLNGTKMSSVNEGTSPTSSQHSMDELGRMIERMITLKANSPTYRPDFKFSKLDIKNGFFRVKLDNLNAYNFY